MSRSMKGVTVTPTAVKATLRMRVRAAAVWTACSTLSGFLAP